jgi:hypothetical protein
MQITGAFIVMNSGFSPRCRCEHVKRSARERDEERHACIRHGQMRHRVSCRMGGSVCAILLSRFVNVAAVERNFVLRA